MIMAEDDIICRDKMANNCGYHAMYDVADDSEIAAGVVIVAMVKAVTYLFQLDDTTDILNEESIPVMEGTLFEYLEEEQCEEEIDYFPITNCRFPTKAELDWCNAKDTL